MLYAHLAFPKWASEHMGAYGPFLYAFERAARQHRQNMSVTYANDADEAVATALEHARSPMCVGTCLCAIPLETRHLVSLAASSGPCVWVDQDSDEAILPRVDFDNYGAGVLMAEKVLRFGHRRITGIIIPKIEAPVQENRRKGFEDALGRAGLKPISSPDWGVMSAGEIAAFLDSPDRPTAIVCRFSDDARSVMAAARELGLRVPEDLSVTVFTGADREGPFSRVVFDVAQLGEESFKRLLDEDVMQNPGKVVLAVSFRDEGTLGPAPVSP
jgi:DNA-binding LacI/PurR family transcriptional regulator